LVAAPLPLLASTSLSEKEEKEEEKVKEDEKEEKEEKKEEPIIQVVTKEKKGKQKKKNIIDIPSSTPSPSPSPPSSASLSTVITRRLWKDLIARINSSFDRLNSRKKKKLNDLDKRIGRVQKAIDKFYDKIIGDDIFADDDDDDDDAMFNDDLPISLSAEVAEDFKAVQGAVKGN
jgi:hypothetical protein